MEDEEIVVVARRLQSDHNWIDREWGWSGFGSYTVYSGVGGVFETLISQAPSDPTTFDTVIGATDEMPKIEIVGVTQAQLEIALDFIDRLAADPRQAAAMQQMADRNVTLRIAFADDLPAGSDPNARAVVSFPFYVESDFVTEGFQPNSVTSITIDRTKIGTATWEDTLEGILAHEFTHFYKDANGQFLDDLYNGATPGNSTQDFNQDVYNLLYGREVAGGYIDSLDLIYDPLTANQSVQANGTNGNNLIQFENDASNATIYTGNGNDVVFSMDGSDYIHLDGIGVKAVYDHGSGLDIVEVALGFMNIKLTMINADLYMTASDSIYSPVEDPNAVILMDHSFDGSGIEYVQVFGGWWVELSTIWAMQSQLSSSSAEGALSTSALSTAIAHNFQSGGVFVESLAMAYSLGMVASVVPGRSEEIPEHLRHLVGGATTMTSFSIVLGASPIIGVPGKSPFAPRDLDVQIGSDFLYASALEIGLEALPYG